MEALLLFSVAALLVLAFSRLVPPRDPPVIVVQMRPTPRADGGGCLLALMIALLLFGFVLAYLS